jgi:excisionase family DNA binding protein
MRPDANFDSTPATRKAAAKLDIPETGIVARLVKPVPAPLRAPPVLSGLEGALLAFLQSKASPAVPIERRIFLTLAESAEFSGLPLALLRRLIASGKLKALKTGSGWRVSRAEMEKAALKLTDPPEELEDQQLLDMEINSRRRRGQTLDSDGI